MDNITTTELIARHPEDFRWLQANADIDFEAQEELYGALAWELVREEDSPAGTAYTYVSDEADVVTINPQSEPNVRIQDDAYAAEVRGQ